MMRTYTRPTRYFVHTAVILTSLLAMTSAPAAAQTTDAPTPPREKKWSLTRGRAFGGNDVAPKLEDAMRSAGLNDVSEGFFFFGGVAYPFSSRVATGTETDVTYRHNSRVAFGLRHTSSHLGSTHGYQAVAGVPFFGRDLTVKSDATTVAAIGYFRISRALRVGVGPVTASTQVSDDPLPFSSRGQQSFKSRVYGGLVTATLEGNIFRYLSLGFTFSRMWIPEVAVGPFTTSSGDSNDAVYGTATLPAMRVNLSHQTFSFNLGIRF